MDGNHTLGYTYSQSACGLNYVQASVMVQKRTAAQSPPFNANGTGLPTTLSISGIPSCATILKAYVWYLVSYLASPQASGVDITNPALATSSFPAANIGVDQDKCWGENGTVNYRADVTPSITGNGNYGINITGITGTGVFPFTNWYDQIDGVTLMIIYQDNGATYQGSIVLWDGTKTGQNGANYTQTMTGINACGNSTFAEAFLLVSDMQENVNVTHASTLNGATANYPSIFYCFDLANTNITAGQATANFGTNGPGSECFDWALMGLYYQTTTCTTCVPAAISVTVSPTQASCGTLGSATAAASGGPQPYTFLWSTGSSSTSVSNLPAGTYSVSVTDGTGCSTSQTFTISSSVGPNTTYTATPILCNGGSSTATLNVSGGTLPYTYGWSTIPPQTGPSASLTAGTYTVVVADANGCSQTTTLAITQPASLALTFTSANPSCNSSNGSASVNASGGTVPYAYLWSTAAVSSAVSNLAPGSYSVAVTDANGCTASISFSIAAPAPMAAAPTATPVLCFGGNSGSASANASGGNTPYTYAWTPAGGAGAVALNLVAGTYTCFISDASGCTQTGTCTVTQPAAALTTSASVVNNVSCFAGSDGSVTTSPSGGTGAYTYVWTPSSQNTQTATGLSMGNYSALVTDANGCTVTQSVSITEPAIISLPSSATLASCGMADGSATVTPSGGVAPYTYLWLTIPVVQSTPTASNLLTGTYSVIVTDANGCFQSQTVVVPGLFPPIADFYFSPEIVYLMDPLVTFTDASGGTITSWHWIFGDPSSGASDSSNAQNPAHVYSDTGTYCITLAIMNVGGACGDTITKCFKVEPQSTFYVPNSFTPNKDGKNEIFYAYGTYIGEFHMYIFDRWGNLIFESNDLYKGWDGSVRNKGDAVQEDVYVWKVKYFDMTGAEFNQVGHVTIVK